MKKWMACIVFLAMLCSCVLGAAQPLPSLDLPKDLKVIGERAFSGTPSVQAVVLPDGAERIESRAFAESGVREAYIPASVSYIAPDAFDGCEDLRVFVPRNSYAHEWLAFSDLTYQLIEPEETVAVYAVAGVLLKEETDEGGSLVRYVEAQVTASEDCTLLMHVLDEAENILHTVRVPVAAPMQEEYLSSVLEAVLPEHYILEAVLVDGAGRQLCAPCRSMRFTQDYARFESSTMADYPKEKVLDFGPSGFAVLADGVIPLAAPAQEDGGSYTFRTGTALSRGDVVLLDVDGVDVIIKAGSIRQNGDGTVTVAPDPDIYLDEMYDAVKISADVQDAPMQQARSDDSRLINVKHSIGFGPVDVTSEVAADIHIDFKYDKNILKDYELKVTLDTEGEIEAVLGAAYDTVKEELLSGEPAPAIQLRNSMAYVPAIHAFVFTDIYVPLHVVAEAGGSAVIGFENHHEYIFSGKNGTSHKKDGTSTAKAEIKGEFELRTGLEASVTVALFGVLNAKIAGNFGPKLTGKEYAPDYGGSTKEDSIHGCTDCLDLDLYLTADVRGTLMYKITKLISGSLLDVKLTAFEHKLKDAYFSVYNEEDSLYGGRESFGWGECKNFKHRVTASAIDRYGKNAPGTPITIKKPVGGVQPEPGVSPYKLYLYNGHYDAEADFGNGILAVDFFEVEDAPVDVKLYEPAVSVSGCVKDYTTGLPIAGATVSLMPPNGMEEMRITDENGCYALDMLPAGEYTFSASAKGYLDTADMKKTLSADAENRVDIELYPEGQRAYEEPYIFAEAWVMDEPIKMSGRTYDDAVAFTMGYTGRESTKHIAEFTYNLKGKYRSMSFDVGYVSGMKKNIKMTVIADGVTRIDEQVIYYDAAPQRITLPVEGVNQLVFHFYGSGYDKARYAIGDIELTGSFSLPDRARVSDSDFAEHILESQWTTVKDKQFSMGGYNYLGGLMMNPGYHGTTNQDAYVIFKPEEGCSMLTFDLVRCPGSGSEESLCAGYLTIEVDGSVLPGYNEVELLWNDLPREILVSIYGASEVKVNLNLKAKGNFFVQWGMGNIQMR